MIAMTTSNSIRVNPGVLFFFTNTPPLQQSCATQSTQTELRSPFTTKLPRRCDKQRPIAAIVSPTGLSF
jgi:hypothetical protein